MSTTLGSLLALRDARRSNLPGMFWVIAVSAFLALALAIAPALP